MYLLNAETTIRWELLPTATPPALADLDILTINPYRDVEYIDSAIAVEDYTPPTGTTNGEVIYKIIPQLEGFWRVRLTTGSALSYQILSKVEMFVFDSTTTTTPYNDTVGKPYPYDINFYLQGFMVPNEIYGTFVSSRNISLSTDVPGSKAIAEEFASFDPLELKILYNENLIGTILFPVLTKIGIITVSPTIIVPGDKLQIVTGSESIDANIRDVAINLVGCCTVVPCSAI